MNSIFIDASTAGISGDMLISALLELQNDRSEVLKEFNQLINSILNQTIELSLTQKKFNDLMGSHLEISSEVNLSIGEINSAIDKANSKLNNPYYKIALDSFNYLIEAESKIHGKESLHLHELGSSDTVIDLVGVAYLLQKLNIQYFDHSPVVLGSGKVKTSHGLLPIPAPVSMEIVSTFQIPTLNSTLNGEAATPTGLAILASLRENLQVQSVNIWKKHALGFGTKEWGDRGNFLRIRLGTSTKKKDKIAVLETNLDDLSGEHLGGVIEVLMKQGALDVSYFPIFMKKNRPGYSLRVLCKENYENSLIETIMKYTGTLGVRVNYIDRHVGSREFVTKQISIKINDEEYQVNIPLKKGMYRMKIEYDYLKTKAQEFNISPLMLEALIWSALGQSEV